MGWRKVAEPEFRPKDMNLKGCRTAISAIPTATVPYLAMGAADYSGRREFVVWFQDLGTKRIGWAGCDPQGFSFFVHPMADGSYRLKAAISQYLGDFGGVWDSGYAYFPD